MLCFDWILNGGVEMPETIPLLLASFANDQTAVWKLEQDENHDSGFLEWASELLV